MIKPSILIFLVSQLQLVLSGKLSYTSPTLPPPPLTLSFFHQIAHAADYGPKWYTCNEYNCKSGCVCASSNPPGGLPVEDTPQFVLLTHDDTVHTSSTSNIDRLVGQLTHINGCRIPCTFFVMTNGSDPKEIYRRFRIGDEIAVHAQNHLNLLDPGIGEEERRYEILGCREWLVEKAGVPQKQVKGYRTPLLAESVEQRQVRKRGRHILYF